jgi:chromosome partitioning protein
VIEYPRDTIDFSKLDELLRRAPPPPQPQAPAATPAATPAAQPAAPAPSPTPAEAEPEQGPAERSPSQDPAAVQPRTAPRLAGNTHVIVFGNEKGGSGKSTAAIHVTVALLRDGHAVGTVDLDAGQWTLTRYLANRNATIKRTGEQMPLPEHFFLAPSKLADRADAEADERQRFVLILEKLAAANRFIVVDCAGTDSHLARLAHSFADTLVTPLNDSFIDLDVIAQVDAATMSVTRPSIYAEMVWEARKRRAKRDGGSIDWIVMRNRLSNLDARNKRDMAAVLEQLGKRIGFRLAPGFGERVIFRELFLRGLTLLDQGQGRGGLTMSNVAARQEVRALMQTVRLPAAQLRVVG